MTTVLRVFLLSAMLAIAAPAAVLADGLPAFPFLIVEGNATADVRPDKATLSVHISAFDADSAVATDTVQKQLVALLGILAAYSIPDDAITSYNLNKQVERARKDRVNMEIVGYHVSRRVKVELSDISRFAELIADISRLDNVSSLNANFDVTDREGIEHRLMNEAGADARRMAENMVDGMSRTVGQVYAVSRSSIRRSMAVFALDAGVGYPAAIARVSADYEQTVFEPSTIELQQSIHVMFELQ